VTDERQRPVDENGPVAVRGRRSSASAALISGASAAVLLRRESSKVAGATASSAAAIATGAVLMAPPGATSRSRRNRNQNLPCSVPDMRLSARSWRLLLADDHRHERGDLHR
jgi:hypothetical protein